MKLLTEMLPQQEAAVEKLVGLKVGALFMEMGTGKTRTALEIISRKMEKGKFEQVLWLCPCSVKRNLRVDIEKHCGEMPEFIRIAGIESISSSPALYVDLIAYCQAAPTMLIVDESSLVKNPRAKRSARIVYLSQLAKYKLILNGTPISKNEADLFNQFYILDPRILGYNSFYSFAANHLVYRTIERGGRRYHTNQIVNVLDTDYLAEMIAPYTYQVKKEDCLDLPPKMYREAYFNLTAKQYEEYIDAREQYLMEVDEFDSSTIYRLFTALQHVASGRSVYDDVNKKMQTSEIFEDFMENPRIQCLKRLMKNDIRGEQVIIFAKYQQEIDEIKGLMKKMKITCRENTGRMKQADREKSLDDFRCGTQVLVTNKRCGAYGLNLQFCHNIIFYSNDFDFATRSQAEDRIHRLGQMDVCYIYDIIANNTIDGMIAGNLDKKGALLAAFKRQIERWKKQKRNGFTIKKAKKLKYPVRFNWVPRKLLQEPIKKKIKKVA